MNRAGTVRKSQARVLDPQPVPVVPAVSSRSKAPALPPTSRLLSSAQTPGVTCPTVPLSVPASLKVSASVPVINAKLIPSAAVPKSAQVLHPNSVKFGMSSDGVLVRTVKTAIEARSPSQQACAPELSEAPELRHVQRVPSPTSKTRTVSPVSSSHTLSPPRNVEMLRKNVSDVHIEHTPFAAAMEVPPLAPSADHEPMVTSIISTVMDQVNSYLEACLPNFQREVGLVSEAVNVLANSLRESDKRCQDLESSLESINQVVVDGRQEMFDAMKLCTDSIDQRLLDIERNASGQHITECHGKHCGAPVQEGDSVSETLNPMIAELYAELEKERNSLEQLARELVPRVNYLDEVVVSLSHGTNTEQVDKLVCYIEELQQTSLPELYTLMGREKHERMAAESHVMSKVTDLEIQCERSLNEAKRIAPGSQPLLSPAVDQLELHNFLEKERQEREALANVVASKVRDVEIMFERAVHDASKIRGPASPTKQPSVSDILESLDLETRARCDHDARTVARNSQECAQIRKWAVSELNQVKLEISVIDVKHQALEKSVAAALVEKEGANSGGYLWGSWRST